MNDPDARDYDSPENWARALATWSETQPFFGTDWTWAACNDPAASAVDSGGHFTCPECWASDCKPQGSCSGPQVNARESLCSSPVSVFEFFAIEIDKFLLASWGDARFLRMASAVREVLSQAWCMIMENLDLVQWAARLAIGPVASEWIHWVMATGWTEVRLRFIPSARFELGNGLAVYFTVPRFPILANPGSDVWNTWTTLWDTAHRPSRTCAVVDAASILFHEMCHYTGMVLADWKNVDCNNGAAYSAGNTFRLALLHRHPRALDEACCGSPYGIANADGGTDVDDYHLFLSLYPFVLKAACV